MQQQECTENASLDKLHLHKCRQLLSRKKELEIKRKGRGWGDPHFTQECQLTTRLEQDIPVNTQTNSASPLLQERSSAIPTLEVCPNGNVLTQATALGQPWHCSWRRHWGYGSAKISPALEASFPLVQLQPFWEAQAGVSWLHLHVPVPHSARTRRLFHKA